MVRWRFARLGVIWLLSLALSVVCVNAASAADTTPPLRVAQLVVMAQQPVQCGGVGGTWGVSTPAQPRANCTGYGPTSMLNASGQPVAVPQVSRVCVEFTSASSCVAYEFYVGTLKTGPRPTTTLHFDPDQPQLYGASAPTTTATTSTTATPTTTEPAPSSTAPTTSAPPATSAEPSTSAAPSTSVSSTAPTTTATATVTETAGPAPSSEVSLSAPQFSVVGGALGLLVFFAAAAFVASLRHGRR